MREIERKFLVPETPSDLQRYPSYMIAQAYLAKDPAGTQVRLRKINDGCWLTVKQGHGIERQEHNIPLDLAKFEALWKLTEGRRLQKTRYDIGHGALKIELDVYHGVNDGLVVAEVEFRTLEECSQFVPPAWFGKEVSEDPEYENEKLARE